MTVHRKLLALSASDWRLLLTATPLVAGLRLSLWLLPSRVILAQARRLVALPERAVAGRPAIERLVWAVEVASARIPRATCLTQAIATQMLMRHYGYGTRLCIGVAPGGNASFRAHAWVERDGSILIGGEESRALSRLTLPAAPRETSSVQVS